MNQNQKQSHIFVLVSLVLVFSILFTGCQSSTQVAAVATEAPTQAPTDTPLPTSTATPVPTNTPTPTATATVTPTATPNRTATQAVKETATQAAVNEMVAAELKKYGIDPSLGHVAWVMEEPVELDGAGFAQGYYVPIKELGAVKDFVVQTEVTWKTSGALAGCGYLFRAPSDWGLDKGDFYEFSILRIQYAPSWFIHYYQGGRWQYVLPSRNGQRSNNLLDENNTKNILTLDARGDKFTIYINGVKERTVENNKIEDGNLGLEVVQNSGSSYCNFTSGWVWQYDK